MSNLFDDTGTSTTFKPISMDDLMLAMKEIRRSDAEPLLFDRMIAAPSIISCLKNDYGRSSRDFHMGIEVVSNPHCYDKKQVRFPRSKKKRIIKKWARRESNFDIIPIALMNSLIDNSILSLIQYKPRV